MPRHPNSYTPELAAKICERLIAGESLRSICRDADMPNIVTVVRWIDNHEEFGKQYARARELQAEGMFEEMLEIADEGTNDTYIDPNTGEQRTNHDVIARSKLRVDTRKWALARMAPKRYGDKQGIEHSGNVGLTVITGVPEPDSADDLV